MYGPKDLKQLENNERLRALLASTPSGKWGKYSLTRDGLEKVTHKLLGVAKERGYQKDDFTSHDLQALFQGKIWKDEDAGWCGVPSDEQAKLIFHPMDKFQAYYSDKMPAVLITYAWKDFRLITDLPRFLDEYEKIVKSESPGSYQERTYWIDIAFNDQNCPDITLYLEIADILYAESERHAAFLFKATLNRAWCCHEAATRLKAAMTAWRLNEEQVAALIRAGDPACTTFVMVPGRTALERDVWGKAGESRRRFDSMEAQVPSDLLAIRSAILARWETPAAFDFAMVVARNAALAKYAQMHPVRPPPPSFRARARATAPCAREAAPAARVCGG
jgi:hypothetical protein